MHTRTLHPSRRQRQHDSWGLPGPHTLILAVEWYPCTHTHTLLVKVSPMHSRALRYPIGPSPNIQSNVKQASKPTNPTHTQPAAPVRPAAPQCRTAYLHRSPGHLTTHILSSGRAHLSSSLPAPIVVPPSAKYGIALLRLCFTPSVLSEARLCPSYPV